MWKEREKYAKKVGKELEKSRERAKSARRDWGQNLTGLHLYVIYWRVRGTMWRYNGDGHEQIDDLIK